MRTLKGLCILTLLAMAVLVTSVPVDADQYGWVRTTVVLGCPDGVDANLIFGFFVNSALVATASGSCNSDQRAQLDVMTSGKATSATVSGTINGGSVAQTISIPSKTKVCSGSLTTACADVTSKSW